MDSSIKSEIGRFLSDPDLVSSQEAYSMSTLVGAAALETAGDREIFGTQIMRLLRLAETDRQQAHARHDDARAQLQSAIYGWCSSIALTLN